jgi:hypothetical protein
MQVNSLKFKSFSAVIKFCYQNMCEVELNGRTISENGELILSKAEIKEIYNEYNDIDNDCDANIDVFEFITGKRR